MFHLSAWLATKRRQINRDDWPFASGSSDLVSQAVGVAPAITRYRKRKKNQDWLVIDRFNVHSTLRVQSSDAFLYNNCFRNIFCSCWTRNKSRAFCYWKNSLSIFSKSYRHNTNSKPIVRVTSEHKYYHLPGCMDPILFLVKYKPFIQYT